MGADAQKWVFGLNTFGERGADQFTCLSVCTLDTCLTVGDGCDCGQFPAHASYCLPPPPFKRVSVVEKSRSQRYPSVPLLRASTINFSCSEEAANNETSSMCLLE